jgi:hypothetical protein
MHLIRALETADHGVYCSATAWYDLALLLLGR